MSDCIRVLQVVTHMNRGGLETMLMNYYRNIDKTKVQFDFLTHRDGEKDYDNEILSLGGKIYHLPILNPFDKNYLDQLDKFFNMHTEYKIVHSHLDCMSTYPLKYAKKQGVPVRIAHSHSTNQDRNLKYILKMYSRSQIPQNATHLFACSAVSGKYMYQKNEFLIINNAINSKKFICDETTSNRMKKELNIVNKFVIGHVGRFDIPKNHNFLIDIFRDIYDKNKEAVLLLIGDGILRQQIEEKVNLLGLKDNVIFTGVRSDIPELLQAMDVFLFPSLFEGLPVTVIEAQAAGLPCLISKNITDEVKITDLVQFISIRDSVDIWVECILKVSKAIQRKNMHQQIIDAGYDINSAAEFLQNFYLGVIK